MREASTAAAHTLNHTEAPEKGSQWCVKRKDDSEDKKRTELSGGPVPKTAESLQGEKS